jgi:hypothetical protein
MNIVQIFDPATLAKDTFVVPQSSANGKIVIWNESNISLMLSFQDGSTAYVPAWCATLFCGRTGSVNITWEQQATLSSLAPPLSQVVVEVYPQGEPVPGTFPMALSRQSNVGNTVNTTGGTATSIQNDGNVAGTSVVEATVSGDGTSAVELQNNGNLTLGNATHHGHISSDNAKFQTDGNGNLTINTLSSGVATQGIAITNVGSVPDLAGVSYNTTGVGIEADGAVTTALGLLTANSLGSQLLMMLLDNKFINFYNPLAISGVASVAYGGNTSGNLTLYQPFQGPALNLVLGYWLNYRNTSGFTQECALPNAFANRAHVLVWDLPSTGIQFKLGGVVQNVEVLTALNSGGGTGTNVATLKGASLGCILSGIDAISIPSGGAGTTTAAFLLIGV